VAVAEAQRLKVVDKRQVVARVVRLPKAAVRPQALAAQVAGAVAQRLRAEARVPEVVAVVALLQPLLQRNSPMAFT
jgi:hypothetical protein